MSSGLRPPHVELSSLLPFALALCLLLGMAHPVAASSQGAIGQQVGADPTIDDRSGRFAQQTANGTGNATADAAGNESDGSDDGGIVGTITGVFGTVAGVIGGVLGAILSFFVDNIIGQAIIGLTIGVLIGLKGLAVYIERYEE